MKTQESIDRFYEWMLDGEEKVEYPFFQDLQQVKMPDNCGVLSPEEEVILENQNEGE